MPVDFDFEVATNVDPRDGAEAGDANAQDMGDVEADAISRMLRIKFRGQEEDIPEEKAITMLQQFKSMDAKYGPMMELARTISEQTGINDPSQIASIMAQGMMKMNEAPAEETAPEAPAEMSDPRAMERNVQTNEQATQQAQMFFEENGLQPTDAAFRAMTNIFKYGDAIEQAATVLPTLMEDVRFKAATRSSDASQQTLLMHRLLLRPRAWH